MSRSICLLLTSFVILKNLSAQQFGTLKDSRDGKIYKTVKIDEQVWMAENLNVSTFRNGDPILHCKTDEEWTKAGRECKPAWCYFNNDVTKATKYGKLYNCFAVNDPRGLAPEGWHIPTTDEWNELFNFFGKNEEAETKLKSKIGWSNKIGVGTNKSGFNALAAGYRGNYAMFSSENEGTIWWASIGKCAYITLGLTFGTDGDRSGFYVRTIKNIDEKDFRSFQQVDKEAEFACGKNGWLSYLYNKYYKSKPDLVNEIFKSSDTVVISFIVSKAGNITNVKPLIANEGKIANYPPTTSKTSDLAVEIIKNSPKWNPALLNGSFVQSHKTVSICFKQIYYEYLKLLDDPDFKHWIYLSSPCL